MLIKFIFKSPLTLFLVVYLSMAGWLYFNQRNIVFHPDVTTPSLSAYADMNVELIQAVSADGISLIGWNFPTENKNMPTLLWFHGNAQNHGTRVDFIKPFLDAGYGAVLASYRGYGGNPGMPTEGGLYQDGRAWIESIQKSGVDLGDLILVGESIGSGVAVQMAVEFPDVKGVALIAPFTSLIDVAKYRYFFMPISLLMKDRFESIDKVKNISVPFMVFQMETDPVVPVKLGKKLHEAANHPKKFVRYNGEGHTNLPYARVAKEISHFMGVTP